MILVSCRAGFDDAVRFGPTAARNGADAVKYWAAELGGRPIVFYKPSSGFNQDKFKIEPGIFIECEDPASVKTVCAGPTVLVHGYDTTAGSAEQSYGVIGAALPDEKMLGYLWPGGSIAVDYPLAVVRAGEAGWRLRDALAAGGTPLDLQTHSLGARVALEALKYSGVRARHLILSAPAVSYDCLDEFREFNAVAANCESVNVFYSRADPVLRDAYPLGTFGGQALGYNGPDGRVPSPNVRAFDCTAVVTTHGGYRFAPQYYAAWRSILDGTAKAGVTVL